MSAKSRHERIGDLFLAAKELPAGERAAFLDRRCGDDPGVRAEVESLLECIDDFIDLDRPAALGAISESPVPARSEGARFPERIGRYRILRKLGSGAMGIVFEARQADPDRAVALKVLRAFAGEDSTRRFRREARVLGRFRHPGIAHVYESGLLEDGSGSPYFAMELVDGLRLDDYAREHELDLRQRLRLMLPICDAVLHAHQHGIIHRDLKPGNILVSEAATSNRVRESDSTERNDDRVIGQPKILDFGIARIRGADDSLQTLATQTGDIVGTIPYMSPEQTSGSRQTVDERTDVYALGVILYELLAGRLPIDVRQQSLAEAIRRIERDEPKALGTVRPDCRGDVETIVGRALEKEPSQRYTSVHDLAEDIRRYLNDRPVLARRPSLRYRALKFARRNRALVGGVAATFLVLMLGFVTTLKYAFDAQEQSRIARWSSYRTAISAAAAEIRSGDIARARALLDEAPEEHRGWEWHYLVRNLETWSMRAELMAPPVGDIGVRGANKIVLALANGRVEVWNTETGELVDEADFGEPLTAFAAHTTAGIGVVGAASGNVSVIDLFTLEPLATRSMTELLEVETEEDEAVSAALSTTAVTDLAVDPGRDAIWIARARSLASVDHRLERVLWQIPIQTNAGADVPFLSDLGAVTGDRFVALYPMRRRHPLVRLGDAATGEWDRREPVPERARCLASSSSGTRIAVGAQYRNVHVIDLATATRKVLYGHANAVRHVAFSDHERRVVSLDTENEIRVWWLDVDAPERVFQLPETVDAQAVRFLPETSRIVATTSSEWFVFDEARSSGRVLRGHDRYVQVVDWSQDGATLVTGANQDGIGLWDAASGRLAGKIRVRYGLVMLELSEDGTRLVGPRASWDASTGEKLGESRNEEDDETTDDTGRRPSLVIRGSQGALRLRARSAHVEIFLLDTDAGSDAGSAVESEPVATLRVGSRVQDIVMHPDGRRLVVATNDGVSIWDVHERAHLADLEAHGGRVYCVEIDAAGTRIFTGGNDGSIWIWDATSFDPLLELKGHTSYVTDVELSPDGATLASASGDATVRFWETTPESTRIAASREYEAARRRMEPLVRGWLGDLDDPARVAQKIRADSTLDRVSRRAAEHVLFGESISRGTSRGVKAGH